MRKICGNCKNGFETTEDDLKFYDKISPIFNGKKYIIPPPTICPDCRMQRRLLFRNERNLYSRKCDITGKLLVTNFSPDKKYKVYDQKEWWSDKWDAKNYGKDFDFKRPFFDQFAELLSEVPFPHITSSIDAVESNCIYTNYAGDNKDCYLVFDSDFNQQSMYSNVLKHSITCLDCSYVYKSELLYECVDCNGCYNLRFSQDCTNCFDSSFLKNCIGCKNCIACANLQHKEFYIFNEPYSKEEYESKLKEVDLSDANAIEKLKALFSKHVLKYPNKSYHGYRTEDSSGDYISNTKNVISSFNVGEARDCKYCDSLYNANDCMDVSSFGEKIELIYESTTIGLTSVNVVFSNVISNECSNILYSIVCRNSGDLFGCCNMNRGKYAVLNKQYSKEEYEALVPKIIEHMKKTGEWGEFFPANISPFGYNETIAQEYFPLTKQETQKIGFKWSEYTPPVPVAKKIIKSSDLPQKIIEVNDDILDTAIECKESGKLFKITKQELDFYRRQNIPLPKFHPDIRHKNRINQRNPRKLYDRNCAKCGIKIQTSYSPERPETVYCEACYLKEVY